MQSLPKPDSAPKSGTDLGKLYTRLAPVYGFWGALTEQRARARALAVAELKAGYSVLEVATGTGIFLAQLANVPGLARIVGVDLAEGMIGRTRKSLGAIPSGRAVMARADARELPVANGVFDIVFNCYMLDLLSGDDIPRVLSEFRRVLKPSGRLVLLVMACQAKVLNSVWTVLYRISPQLVGGCRPVPMLEFLTAQGWKVDVRERITQCGFRSELFVATPASGGLPRD